ncbi:MAG: hypothetical protein K9J42_11860, partial [Sulfuritalea sp.]|nr:hypothetical protein [Sulfuritalea sp.]
TRRKAARLLSPGRRVAVRAVVNVSHLILKVDSPTNTSRMVMIQKRIFAFGVATTVGPLALA